jgi:hypothetical protein
VRDIGLEAYGNISFIFPSCRYHRLWAKS